MGVRLCIPCVSLGGGVCGGEALYPLCESWGRGLWGWGPIPCVSLGGGVCGGGALSLV